MLAITDDGLAELVAMVDGAIAVEGADGRLVVVNPAFAELLGGGRAPEQLAGQPFAAIVAERSGDAPEMLEQLGRLRSAGAVARLPELELPDGRCIEGSYRPLAEGAAGARHLWQFQDVTDRHALAQALNERQAHLRAVFDNSPVGMFQSDAAGQCVAVNRGWQELTGQSAEEALGTGWMRVLHPDDRERVIAGWRKASANGRPVQNEYRVCTPEGRVHWVITRTSAIRDGDGVTTGYVGSALDITDRRRAEDRLRASQARSAATIATAIDGIISFDYEGRVLELNAAAEAILRCRRDELIGRSGFQLLVPPEQRAAARAGLARYLRTGEARLIGGRLETTVLRFDGEPFPADVAIVDIAEADPPMLTVFVRDISERRRAERLLADARDAALEASRLKSEFLAVMSHEIRTPMYGMTGAVDLLRDGALDAEQRELVEILADSSQTLLELIDEILDFSKIEAGRLELQVGELDPAATVESATELFAAEARRTGLSLMAVIEPGVPAAIRGDATRLRQIVGNLVGNALKFTDAGEVIVRLGATSDGRLLRLEVCDSGPGIAPHLQRTLFEPFTQGDQSSDRRHGGTGLGLAICERLVRLMGGAIAVDSAPGAGTTMKVEIPCEPVAGARADWEAPPALRGRSAAVAMTTPRLAAAMEDALRSIGLTVPGSIEPDGVDVWVAEVESRDAAPAGARIAVLGQDERDSGPLPVRRAPLAEIVLHALEHDAPAAAPDSGPGPAEPPALDAARVLVVEDNEANRQLALLQLARLGLDGRAAASGRRAIDTVRDGGFDAVLMDCRMPGLSGFDATRAIRDAERGSGRRIPIIAMTADAQEEDRERCLAAGMDDYLAKPLSLDQLQATLSRWVGPSRSSAPPLRSAGGLAQLVEELGSVMAAAEIVELWLRELPLRRSALHTALEAGDCGAVTDLAHTLRSTTALFDADAAALAADVLADARRGDCRAAARRVDDLERALAATERSLRRWRAETVGDAAA